MDSSYLNGAYLRFYFNVFADLLDTVQIGAVIHILSFDNEQPFIKVITNGS